MKYLKEHSEFLDLDSDQSTHYNKYYFIMSDDEKYFYPDFSQYERNLGFHIRFVNSNFYHVNALKLVKMGFYNKESAIKMLKENIRKAKELVENKKLQKSLGGYQWVDTKFPLNNSLRWISKDESLYSNVSGMSLFQIADNYIKSNPKVVEFEVGLMKSDEINL